MKLAIMQPYFLPYIGYWQLINHVDEFLILDDVAFIMRGWIHKNRILCEGKEQFLIDPIWKRSQNKRICDTSFIHHPVYVMNLKRTIRYAYRKAPYIDVVMNLVDIIFDFDNNNTALFLENQLHVICNYLEINTRINRTSEFRGCNHKKGQEGILELCRICECDEYVNPFGGIELYKKEIFEKYGIDLYFLKSDMEAMRREREIMCSDYSIIHLLAWHSKKEVKELLRYYEIF